VSRLRNLSVEDAVTIKRPGRKAIDASPEQSITVEEYMWLAKVLLRTARYHIQKGIVVLAPADTGKNRRLRRMIL